MSPLGVSLHKGDRLVDEALRVIFHGVFLIESVKAIVRFSFYYPFELC